MSLTQFTLFPELPLELRLKIWGIALTQPRTITIDCKKGYSDMKRRVTEYFICRDRPHPILQVDSESRYEALATYGYAPLFQVPTSERYVHANLLYNVIRCPAAVLEYLGDKEIKDMRKMVLEVGDGAYFGHFHMDTIRRMESLEELTLRTHLKQIYTWGRSGDLVLTRLRADFEGARYEDPGWNCPRVGLIDLDSGEETNVVKGGALFEGWKIGDDYPEHLL